MKKRFGLLAALVMAVVTLAGCSKPLPKAWGEEGSTTYKSAECKLTINPTLYEGAEALADYMGRKDVVYVDLRNEAEGYAAGHIEGFISFSWFKVICGNDDQLFYTEDNNVTFKARYNESVTEFEKVFPKDKAIFAMCQVGGRVANFMKLLAFLGYDMTRCYNIGGQNDVQDGLGLTVSTDTTVPSITYDYTKFTKK
ncbi:MAG: hypothetical protein IJV94_02630 [Bacilli bacterium]|nr:hypothetical protein [Bacilli bacterium]